MMAFNITYKLMKKTGLLLTFLSLCIAAMQANDNPVGLVNPYVDAVNSRWFFFSSACRPFGMVSLFPDTQTGGDWGSGYRYNTDTIKGFSHVHDWQIAGVSVQPVVPGKINPENLFTDYYSKFSHSTEKVSPGYHSVMMERYSIRAELTSTQRVGFHRYTFADTQEAAVLFILNGQLGPGRMVDGELTQVDEFTLEGRTVNAPTLRRPENFSVFFRATLNVPVHSVVKNSVTGNYRINVKVPATKEVLMKVAVSYTSTQNAANNLHTELSGWDFDAAVTDAQDEWNRWLSRIEVKGGTLAQRQRFYTDLWHALQGRRMINDCNGAYPDNTGTHFRIGQLPLDKNGKPLYNHYNSDSFWGAQWTISTLWGLVYPELMVEFSKSMMQYFRDGGLIPRGPAGGNYTYVMTGASSTPFIVSAIQKGLLTDDLDEIYNALKKNHLPGGIMEKAGYEHHTRLGGGFSYYLKNGYVPYPVPEGKFGFHQQGASLTLEYAYQDWTLAQLAKKLGHPADYDEFMKRSGNFRNVYDAKNGWMRPKDVQGNWHPHFDPFQHELGFIESNASQSSWFVPHDIPGLAKLMGGKAKTSSKLNELFLLAEKQGFTIGSSHDLEQHPEYNRVPINYGNQPSIQTANIFNHLGRPWLTQYWSRKVVETVYEGLSPERGYNGDEDQGLMGALAVLMKIGLFSVDGGCSVTPTLELGSPVFDNITLHLNPDYYDGKTIEIEVVNNGPENCYIQSATLNGKKLNTWKLDHKELVKGATLQLVMGNAPNTKWGK